MSVHKPGRHPAFEPIGRLRASPFGGGKKSMMMPLNLTAMIDMFTVIVIYLLQNFSSSGELQAIQKDLKLPQASQTEPLNERGPMITLFQNNVLIEGEQVGSLAELDDADPGIPALQTKLHAIRDNEAKLNPAAADPTKPYEGKILIQADASTDFQLVRKTIFSANDAGWTHLEFAVLGEAKPPDPSAEENAP